MEISSWNGKDTSISINFWSWTSQSEIMMDCIKVFKQYFPFGKDRKRHPGVIATKLIHRIFYLLYGQQVLFK